MAIMHQQLDSLVRLGMDSMAFPGAQILIRHRDSIIYHRTWGHHTYDQKVDVKKEDLYDLASVTKVSSGLPILMQLYGRGLLNLDVPLQTYFHALKRSNKKHLSLRETLAHQAGLTPYIVFYKNAVKKNGKYKCKTFKDRWSKRFPIEITDGLYLHRNYHKKMKKAIRKSTIKNRGNYAYSGLTFLLMPEAISELVNERFEEYLYREIFAAIGAKHLTYNPMQKYDRAQIIPTEYDTLWRHRLVHGSVHDEAAAMLGGVSCNAGLFGDAESLSRLFQLYLNEGEWSGKQIIPTHAIREFTTYQYEDNRRGLGFDKPLRVYDADLAYVAESASPTSYGHSGFTGTMVWADPDHDLVFVFLSNRVYPSRSHRHLYTLSLRPKLHQAVYDYILRGREDL